MIASRRKALFVLGSMAGAAAIAEVTKPTVHIADRGPKVDLEATFPKQFGSWRLETGVPVILPAPDVQAVLNKIYNQVLSRAYVNADGARIMLSVAYGGDQSDGTRAHRPEVCYPAQGFSISADHTETLNVGSRSLVARRLVAQQGGRYEPITYWVMVGTKPVISGTEQKLAQLRYGLRGEIPDGMLVRVSSIDRDAAAAYRMHEGFINDLSRAVDGQMHGRVFGA